MLGHFNIHSISAAKITKLVLQVKRKKPNGFYKYANNLLLRHKKLIFFKSQNKAPLD